MYFCIGSIVATASYWIGVFTATRWTGVRDGKLGGALKLCPFELRLTEQPLKNAGSKILSRIITLNLMAIDLPFLLTLRRSVESVVIME